MTANALHFDIESPPHKALRLAMGSLSARLGQSSALTPDLRLDCLNALNLLDWHTDWSHGVVLPLVESLEPGVVAGVSQAYAQVTEQVAKIRRLTANRDGDCGASASVPINRLYQHWSLLQASSHALMHTEETVVQATLNQKATADQIARVMSAFRKNHPPALEPWLAMALPSSDHSNWLEKGAHDA